MARVPAAQGDYGSPRVLAPCRVAAVGFQLPGSAARLADRGRRWSACSELAGLGRERDAVSDHLARDGGERFARAGRELL